MEHVYREQSLQLSAINWLTRKWGYLEIHSDDMAVGDRMDSAGVLEGRALMIEVKPAINRGMVWHASNRPGSLESKIAGTLGPLYRNANDHLTTLIRTIWDCQRPPMVAFLAARYSKEGIDELQSMLERRCIEWRFDWRIWRWTGSEIEAIVDFVGMEPVPASRYAEIQIPLLVGRAQRSPARTLEEFRMLANSRGVGPLFDHAIGAAGRAGLKIKRSRNSIEIFRARASVGGIYLGASDAAHGLNIGILEKGLADAFGAMPGRPAARAGFFNTNRYASTTTEVDALLQLMAHTRGRGGSTRERDAP